MRGWLTSPPSRASLDALPWRTRRKQFWKSAYVTVGIGLAVVAALTYANRHGGLESVELSASDRLIYRPGAYQDPSGAVVVARIDDKSIAELGRWPWGRDVQAQLVRASTDYQAAVVGFDVMLPSAIPPTFSANRFRKS